MAVTPPHLSRYSVEVLYCRETQVLSVLFSSTCLSSAFQFGFWKLSEHSPSKLWSHQPEQKQFDITLFNVSNKTSVRPLVLVNASCFNSLKLINFPHWEAETITAAWRLVLDWVQWMWYPDRGKGLVIEQEVKRILHVLRCYALLLTCRGNNLFNWESTEQRGKMSL